MSLPTIRAHRALLILLAPVLTVTFMAPAAAQSREQRQLMADMRMLQEQNQVLQNLLGSIVEAIKAVNGRIDEQSKATGKSLADQKLVIDNLTNNVREIREKLDDSTVRLGSLNQEIEALRQGLEQLSAPPPLPAITGEPGAAPGVPGAPGAGAPGAGVPGTGDPAAAPVAVAPPPPTVPLGTSPQKLYDQAQADYGLGQFDLAIAGFEALIKYFPRTERAADAQVQIGNSYIQAGNNEKAVEAYDAAIRNYPAGVLIPEAYYRKGVALKNLKQLDAAKASFEHVVKTYPDSFAASLARQGIAQLGLKN